MKFNILIFIFINLIFGDFNPIFSQNYLPVLEHHSLYETKNEYILVWLIQKPIKGLWFTEL